MFFSTGDVIGIEILGLIATEDFEDMNLGFILRNWQKMAQLSPFQVDLMVPW